jgi:hypothetical protein
VKCVSDKTTSTRPPAPRTRALWKLNVGRGWRGDVPGLSSGAQYETRRLYRMFGRDWNSVEELLELIAVPMILIALSLPKLRTWVRFPSPAP